MKSYLLDAFPILCWLQQEPGHAMVDDLLKQAEEGKLSLSMHIMNLGEVFYRIYRVAGASKAEEVVSKLRMLPVSILSVSDLGVMEAARIKGKYRVSFADAFAVAAALEHKAIVVTGDPEYRAVSRLVKILWVR